jgi:hypothetical protein
VGLPQSGPGAGSETDVVVILYSAPDALAGVIFATVVVAGVPIVARWWRGAPLTDDDDEAAAPADA